MKHLPVTDLAIIALYMIAMLATGIWFSKRNRNPDQFTRASGKIPQWAVGISIYATFLSSNTFLGVPGKAFGGNWNSFVFSLSMPFAAWIASAWFIPFYRKSGEISAYTHLGNRFGPWARTYAVVCFLLTQLARMGAVFFGIALTLQAISGYPMHSIMLVMGIIITIYTVLGGMEAVIWTEVAQAVIKTAGAFIILYFIVVKMPGGVSQLVSIGRSAGKFSLGSFRPDFTTSTFWVVFLYGLFINLNNFGMDQNYVQRYQATTSAKAAARSVWLCVLLYLPVSLLFFIIGSSLYAWYQVHPEMLDAVKLRAAAERLAANADHNQIVNLARNLKPSDYGDKVLPDFMVNMLPTGVVGIIISALLSAAMSTISSGMNASATVFTFDIYKRYIHKEPTNMQTFSALLTATLIIGVLAIVTGIAMIGVNSILDTWWQLSGIFAAGMLGLFLLGIFSRQTRNTEAIIAVVVGVLVIAWMTFPSIIPAQFSGLRSAMNTNMVIVIGTTSIFLTGVLLSRLKRKPARLLIICCFFLAASATAQPAIEKTPEVFATLVFPMQPQHVHASSLVSLPNGDLLIAWYQGSGERTADDVRVMGARLKKGSRVWSDPFLMADTHDLPDCNPVLFLNSHNQLFLVWIAVQAHRWECSLLKYRTSSDYLHDGAPSWNWQDNILLAPNDSFATETATKFKQLTPGPGSQAAYAPGYDDLIVAASRDSTKRSTGWMTRIKPLRLRSGRLLLPLYSDGFSMSIVAISDDDGTTWRPSLPIVGRGNVQPALVGEKNGNILAYMRDNGAQPSRVQVSESTDDGYSWSAAHKTSIPNEASVELIVLQDGRWAFVGNDEDDGRYRLSFYLSDDEGKTWKWKRTLENSQPGEGRFSYPSLIQTADGLLHLSYSYSLEKGTESIKYVEIDPKQIK